MKNNLKERRDYLYKSQKGIAEKCGLHYTTLSRIEREQREPSLKTALKIATAMRTKVEQLWELEPEDWA
jgi:DNA-binding XRE family transcriptional regulator